MENTSWQETQGGNFKPFINKATIARQNRKTALIRSNFSEFSLLLQLPEDLFLVVAAFLAISDISRLRKTCSCANQLCTSNFLWKRDFLNKLDFLDDSVLSNSLLAYKLFYNTKLSTERASRATVRLCRTVECKGKKTFGGK